LGEIDSGLFGRSDLEQQWFLEHQRPIAAYRIRFTLRIRGR
jgi:hypothetical protein